MTVSIKLSDDDFMSIMTQEERAAIWGRERVLGDSRRKLTVDEMLDELLPRVLVAKIRKLTPPDFELTEITIDAEVSGKVAGTGVSGTFSMKLGRIQNES